MTQPKSLCLFVVWMWMQNSFFICFSKSVFWLVCLLCNYYCAAITQAQFIERNAVNFLLALGGYGLFFLFLGANFFLLPSLTSCLGDWLHREAAEVSVRSQWLDFCYPSPSASLLHYDKLPDHIHLDLACQRHGLCFFLMRIWREQGEMLFKHHSVEHDRRTHKGDFEGR